MRWLLVFLVACGGATRGRDWETTKFWRENPARVSCASAATATTFVLGEACEVDGVALPAGAGVARGPDAGELRVYPPDPLRMSGGLTCRRDHEVVFSGGRLAHCWLAKRAVVDGISIGPSETSFDRDGHLASGMLDADQDIGGLPLAGDSYIKLNRPGALGGGELRVDHVVLGWRVPSRSSVWFHDNGNVALIVFSQPTRITAGAWSGVAHEVRFAESGAVETVTVTKPDYTVVDLVFDADGHVTGEIAHGPEEIQIVSGPS